MPIKSDLAKRNKDLFSRQPPTWCPGCGLYGILEALKRAAVSLELEPAEIVVVTGIGCHGRFPNYFLSYGFHGLHGRVVPVASGIKMVNPKLKVIGISGDGDAYSIGLNHLLHAARRNSNILIIVPNNRVFALTQGQASPTSPRGFVSISTPFGTVETPLDGLKLALGAGATFIARGFSGEVDHLVSLFKAGLSHSGFALIDVLSPCITYNKINTYDWYKKRIEILPSTEEVANDKEQAWRWLNREDRFVLGILYMEVRDSFEQLILSDSKRAIAHLELHPEKEKVFRLMEKFI
ncbi:MAG: 2-oxoacid:ferredoxin oxidoreductase subunit beta [Candidatus Aminicenantes bacterium]|nr:2-oxoacid:ferredoxin oxidoreductase subunit beta [Candidatus Aminicenantes bacterium]